MSACSSSPAQDRAVASQTDVSLTITQVLPTGSTAGSTSSTVQVIFRQQDSEITGRDLTENETFSCNGANLALDGSLRFTFVGSVPDTGAGSSFACVYERQGDRASLRASPTQQFRVLSPMVYQVVPVDDLLVTFTAAPGSQVRATLSDNFKTYTSTPIQASPGARMLTIPKAVLALFAGDHVTLSVLTLTPLASSARGFRSAVATEASETAVPLQIL